MYFIDDHSSALLGFHREKNLIVVRFPPIKGIHPKGYTKFFSRDHAGAAEMLDFMEKYMVKKAKAEEEKGPITLKPSMVDNIIAGAKKRSGSIK